MGENKILPEDELLLVFTKNFKSNLSLYVPPKGTPVIGMGNENRDIRTQLKELHENLNSEKRTRPNNASVNIDIKTIKSLQMKIKKDLDKLYSLLVKYEDLRGKAIYEVREMYKKNLNSEFFETAESNLKNRYIIDGHYKKLSKLFDKTDLKRTPKGLIKFVDLVSIFIKEMGLSPLTDEQKSQVLSGIRLYRSKKKKPT